MTDHTWLLCLDRLEQHLIAQHAALRRGAPEQIEPFDPGPDLGPLPAALVERAGHLHALTTALQHGLTQLRDDVARAMSHTGMTNAERTQPSFLDSHG